MAAEVDCPRCNGQGYRWVETGGTVRARNGSRARWPETKRVPCKNCNGGGSAEVKPENGPWRIRLNADNTVAGMQLLDFPPGGGQRDVIVVPIPDASSRQGEG